jgi:hypothetical protein
MISQAPASRALDRLARNPGGTTWRTAGIERQARREASRRTALCPICS